MMNKNIYILMFSSLLLFGSCNVLETEDLGSYSPDEVWNDESLAGAYLTDLYAETFRGGWPTDEGRFTDESSRMILGISAVTATNAPSAWVYEFIRDINVLLENVPKGELSKAVQDNLLGQAYFLRAFNYWQMLEFHGGIPIVDKVQTAEDDLFVKRNTSLECFNFIIKDLDAAAALVPLKNTGDAYGRIDQCMVAAFKGRVLLLMASPQFNKSKPYSNSYLTEAYDATKAAKDLLETNGYGLLADYTSVFETKAHKEAVLPFIFLAPSKVNSRVEAGVRPLSESKGQQGLDVPLWGFAESYPMLDGKKIGESTKYTYDDQTYWLNRDPRFAATVVWNGSIYELSGKTGRRQYTLFPIASSLDAFGLGIVGETASVTGLFCRKGISEHLSAAQNGQNDYDWLEMRFAEVLFNYAEMANEKGETTEAYDVLKKIRQRAGIEAGADGLYGLQAGMSKELMRTALLDEKRIEFAFEGQRWGDLRRHRLWHTLIHGTTKHGVLATLKPGLTMEAAQEKGAKYELLPEEFTYTFPDVVAYFDKNADNKMNVFDTYYFYPIRKSNIDQNSNLEQSDDWGGSFNNELP